MRKYILASALALAATACGDDDVIVDDATITVSNESDFVIEEIYLTPVDNPDWGPNLLGGDVLLPGEALTLGVQCDFYDALIVDEDGVECELSGVDLCLNDADWIIRNNTCTIFEAAAKARKEQAARQSEQAVAPN